MSDRWIKLYIRLLEDELWCGLSPGHRCVMLGLLLLAEWRGSSEWVPSLRRKVRVPRGALMLGQRALAEKLTLDRKTVRGGLRQLEAAGFLAIDEVGRDWRGNPIRRYRITNYDRYQAGDGAGTEDAVGGPIRDRARDHGRDPSSLERVDRARRPQRGRRHLCPIPRLLPPPDADDLPPADDEAIG